MLKKHFSIELNVRWIRQTFVTANNLKDRRNWTQWKIYLVFLQPKSFSLSNHDLLRNQLSHFMMYWFGIQSNIKAGISNCFCKRETASDLPRLLQYCRKQREQDPQRREEKVERQKKWDTDVERKNLHSSRSQAYSGIEEFEFCCFSHSFLQQKGWKIRHK